MYLLIDNYDSFTYNLADVFRRQGQEVLVQANDRVTIGEIVELNPQAIMISPGPGTPRTAGQCLAVVSELGGRFPILGICLGHQVIGEVFGGRVRLSDRAVHGKVQSMQHFGDELFEGVEEFFMATRYHSLIVDDIDEDQLQVICRSGRAEIMGVRHREYPVVGLQFHPESYGCRDGEKILANFTRYYVENFRQNRRAV